MKSKLKGYRFLPAVMLSSAALLLPVLAMAQEVGNPDAPIDGGLSLLLAAGAAYGVKKYRDGKKKDEEQGVK